MPCYKPWNDDGIIGYPLYRLMCKLKATKQAFKTWISSSYFDTPRQHIDGIRQKPDSHQK